MVLLSTAFCPPMEYFALLAKGPVYLEACENYQKQSYRNRLRFYSASGAEDLSFPVVHEGGTFCLPIRQIRVDYSTQWVRRARRALTSAYSSAAFFPYYSDGLFDILESRPQRLWDLNMALIRYFCDILGINPQIRLTDNFIPFGAEGCEDYRNAIHPKKPMPEGLDTMKPYFQVFSPKYGFIPGLSVLDYVFNSGGGEGF